MSKVKKEDRKVLVSDLVKEFRESGNSRFKTKELQMLLYAVLSDDKHVAKKLTHDMKKLEVKEEEVNYAKLLRTLMVGVLKSAGMKEEEAEEIAKNYDFKSKDVSFILDVVEEVQVLYFESGKAVKVWANHTLDLLVKKYEKSGKYAGTIGYQRKIVDKDARMEKKRNS